MIERSDGLTVTVGADIAPLRSSLTEASRLSSGFARDLTRSFESAAIRGRDLSEVLRGLALSLSRRTLQAAFMPFERALGQGLSALFGGAGGGASLMPFAKGGVIASPVAFPLGGSKLGLAGEAGPEAILPLARGADGRLGVRAEAAAPSVSIAFNVTATDAESFRRSEGQIAAMLSRVVSRGGRNL